MSHGFYFGFRNRVIVLTMSIILLFALGCLAMFYSFRYSSDSKVKYNEKSILNYQVCLLPNDIYSEECIESKKTYSSLLTDKVKIDYTYEANFSDDIDREFYYHVIVYNEIYDGNNSSKILYENSDLVIDKTLITKEGRRYSFNIEKDIDYKKYNDVVDRYKEKYFSDVKAKLNVVIYLDDVGDERKIGAIQIPLSEKTFNIKTKSVENSKKNLNIEYNEFETDGAIYLIIGGLLIVGSLILDFRLVRLVKMTFTKKSKYEIELSKLLREYDKHIVNSKDGYTYDESKDIVKVESLKELVDAANIISKPVIYSKINNVKSEFIVEDTDKVYKYVLKDSFSED